MIAAVLVLASCTTDASSITFTGPNDWTFDGTLHAPAEATGPAVLLIGGGVGNDLDWTVPGSLSFDDTVVPVTLNGETHADAPRLVEPLLKAGCTVMHYSTIAREDPKREKWPYELGMIDPAMHMALARDACEALERHVGPDRPLVILGHSMGGQRAVQLLAERPRIAGCVLLACAQATATSTNDEGGGVQSARAAELHEALDVDGDGEILVSELDATQSMLRDVDGDGTIRRWEIEAMLAHSARLASDGGALPTHDRFGLPFAEWVLRDDTRPCLMIYGALDNAQACHAPELSRLASTRTHLEIRIMPGIGHKLGPESEGRIGPIDSAVCGAIARWLSMQTWATTAERHPSSDARRPG